MVFSFAGVSRNAVVSAKHEHRGFGFYPQVGFLEDFWRHLFECFTDGFYRELASFARGVVFVCAAVYAFLNRGHAFCFGELEHPSGEFLCREFAFRIGDKDGELFFDGGFLGFCFSFFFFLESVQGF